MPNGLLQRLQRRGLIGSGLGVRQTIDPQTGASTMPLGGSLMPFGPADIRGGLERIGGGAVQRAPLQPSRFTFGKPGGFLSQRMQQQRGARAGVGGQRQGPPTAQMKMRFPGQDPRRNIFGGRQFGAGTRTARSILQQGGQGLLGFGRQPLSFGTLGRSFGRLGQRRSPF